MIDLAKIADLALVVIDASVGFEMETFEFLTILQTHGFPSVMGVLTHLDYFKQNKQQQKAKKKMKKRFWKEVYEGAKLFYLSGIHYEMYLKNEIRNLARFISIIKVKPLEWKSHHPYILADRYDISTSVKDKETEKTQVSIYGYVRGSLFNRNNNVYITGLGDYKVQDAATLVDPCPTLVSELKAEEEVVEEVKEGQPPAQKKKKKRRTLSQKEKVLYAPMSNLDFASIDHSNGYITLPDKYVFYTKMPGVQRQDGGAAQKMMEELQEMKRPMDQQFDKPEEAPEIMAGVTLSGQDDLVKKESSKSADAPIPLPNIEAEMTESFADVIRKAIYEPYCVRINLDQ